MHQEGKFLVTKYEFGGNFGMSLSWDCHEVEVTPNLEFLVTFGMSLVWVCHELVGNDIKNLEGAKAKLKNLAEKGPS